MYDLTVIASLCIIIIIGSKGGITFSGVAPGKYRLRVVASTTGHSQSVRGRRVVIPRPSYCRVNLIIEDVIINESNMTVHFRGVGHVKEFLCAFDRETKFHVSLLHLVCVLSLL